MLMKTLTMTGIAALLGLSIMVPATAGTIENLERERAIMVKTLLDPNMPPRERQAKLSVSQRRLIDLERIVLRDKDLVGRQTPAVRRAFANYDLTFLVHASTEKDLMLMDHWMEQIGLSTQTLLSSQPGRRF